VILDLGVCRLYNNLVAKCPEFISCFVSDAVQIVFSIQNRWSRFRFFRSLAIIHKLVFHPHYGFIPIIPLSGQKIKENPTGHVSSHSAGLCLLEKRELAFISQEHADQLCTYWIVLRPTQLLI
jgi:hypothetical protein